MPHEVATRGGRCWQRTATCDPALARSSVRGAGGTTKPRGLPVSLLKAGDIEDAIETASGALFATLPARVHNLSCSFCWNCRIRARPRRRTICLLAESRGSAAGRSSMRRNMPTSGAYFFDNNPIRIPAAGATRCANVQPQDGHRRGCCARISGDRRLASGASEPRSGHLQIRYELALALLPQVQTLEPDLEHGTPPRCSNWAARSEPIEVRDKRRLPRPWPAKLRRKTNKSVRSAIRYQKISAGGIHPAALVALRYETHARTRYRASTIRPWRKSSTHSSPMPKRRTTRRPENRLQPSTKSALFWLSRDDIDQAVHNASYADLDLRPLLLMTAARLPSKAISPHRTKPRMLYHLLAEAVAAYNEAFAAREDPKTPLPGSRIAGIMRK